MPDERAVIDRVGRYWDAVVLGDAAPDVDLEPGLAETIHRVHALAANPPSSARERVWQSVLGNEVARREVAAPVLHVLPPSGLTLNVPGAELPSRAGLGGARQRWLLTQLATAALLVLTLAGSFFAFGTGRRNQADDPPTFIPAISATPATPDTATAPGAEFLWSTTGDPSDPLEDPFNLTIDPDGNLWAPDGLNNRFQIFAPDGTFLEAWGTPGSGDGELDLVSDPYGVGAAAFDAAGNLYVADYGNSRIQKFSPDRSFLRAWGVEGNEDSRILEPIDVAIDDSGNVYVSDAGAELVRVFDDDGQFLTKWGGLGSGEGQFLEIAGLATDGEGNILVADAGAHRIQKFSPDGMLLDSWGDYGVGPGQFRDPNDIAVDGDGRIFVTDWENHRIQVFARDGRFLTAWGNKGVGDGEVDGPMGIALDGLGHAYVSEDGNDRLQAFRLLPPLAPTEPSPVAEFLWESEGASDAPFREPNHPVVDPQGNIWIPDGWNSHFAIYAPDGTLLETWGTEGSGDGEFLFESSGIGFGGVAFDAAGNIYVADPGNYRIQKFGPDRTFIAAWGSNGSEDGQLRQPVALVVDERERVYVSDRWGSVEVFDTDGQWLASWDGLGNPVGIAVDGNGNIWLADEGLGQVIQFSPDGERLDTWDNAGSDDGELTSPSGVAVDARGRIFVSDRGNRVQIFSPTQVFSPDPTFLASWGERGTAKGQFNGPYGVTVDDHGRVYVAEDYGLRVQAFQLQPPFAPAEPSDAAAPAAAQSNVAELVWQTEGGPDLPLDGPYKTSIDPAGNLWIPDGRNHHFQIFSPDGEFLETWGTAGSGDGQFDFVLGEGGYGTVIWDKDGNFYVADSGNYRIQKFAPDRSFLTAWGSEGTGEGQFMGLNDLALDRESRLYATDGGRDVIQVFDRDGRILDSWGSPGVAPGQFLSPGGIAVDVDGNLIISEYEGHRIQKLSPDGKPLAMWGSYGTENGKFMNPEDVILDGQGRVFVTEWSNHRVQVFEADGTFLATWGGAAGLRDGEFEHPNGATLDGDGFMYVSDEGNDTVLKFRLLPPLAPG